MWLGAARRVALVAFAASTVVALVPAPASAHAVLVRSDPVSGATLGSAPEVVHLWFSEDVAPAFVSIHLVDGEGREVGGTRTVTSALDARAVDVLLPPIEPGPYAVTWRVLAEDDGHTTSGVVAFGAGVDSPAAVAGSAQDRDTTTPVAVGLRWLRLVLMSCVVGGLAVALLVLGRSGSGAADSIVRSLRSAQARVLGVASFAAIVAVPATVAEAVPTAVSLGGLSSLGQVLDGTRGGRMLLGQAGLLFLLGLISVRLWARSRAALVEGPRAVIAMTAALVAGLAALESLRGHPSALDTARGTALLADAVHVACALLWLGGLVALVNILMPGRDRRSTARLVAPGFTRLAGGSLLLLVVTGLYSAGREVHDPAALTSTDYGRAVVAKAGLLAVLVGLAAVNHQRLHEPRHGITRRLVVVEAAVGGAALVGAALLAQSVPSPTPPTTVGTGERPVMEAARADLLVSASAAPDRPGTNAFTVLVASSHRPEPAPIDAVRLRIGRGPALATVAVEPGRYVATGDLDADQTRRVTVLVERAGRTYAVPLRWRLASPPPVVTVEPAHPLAAYTTPLAMAVPVVAALSLLMLSLRRRLRARRGLLEVPG